MIAFPFFPECVLAVQAPGRKGDLRIHFDIIFPTSLTDEQKATLRRVLPAG